MPIRKPSVTVRHALKRALSTSIYESRTPVPAWGEDGELVQFFEVSNNKDRAVLYANTRAIGLRAPELHVTTDVDIELNELDQLITELTAIRDDLLKEQARITRADDMSPQDALSQVVNAIAQIAAKKPNG